MKILPKHFIPQMYSPDIYLPRDLFIEYINNSYSSIIDKKPIEWPKRFE